MKINSENFDFNVLFDATFDFTKCYKNSYVL